MADALHALSRLGLGALNLSWLKQQQKCVSSKSSKVSLRQGTNSWKRLHCSTRVQAHSQLTTSFGRWAHTRYVNPASADHIARCLHVITHDVHMPTHFNMSLQDVLHSMPTKQLSIPKTSYHVLDCTKHKIHVVVMCITNFTSSSLSA